MRGIGRCEFEYRQFRKISPALARRTKNGLLTSLQQQLVKTGRCLIQQLDITDVFAMSCPVDLGKNVGSTRPKIGTPQSERRLSRTEFRAKDYTRG